MESKAQEYCVSIEKKKKRPENSRDAAIREPEPVTRIDHIVMDIRRFIAAAIFFNSQVAEKVGLGMTDMQVIHMLRLNGPSTPSRLAAWTGLSSGGVTVALDRLEKGGYIRREPNPADRRSLLIVLKPQRTGRIHAQYEDVERRTREQLATLTESDQAAVVRFFRALGAGEDRSGSPE